MNIPKVIHYCWFGHGKMSSLHLSCLESWKEYIPDYRFRLWNEENSPMDIPFVNHHYKKKNWAFVSDYIRLYAIYMEGGVYLDVDFEIIKPLDPILENECFLGEESPGRVTNGICGAVKRHDFFRKAMQFMDCRHAQKKSVLTSPEVCMAVYGNLDSSTKQQIKVYPDYYFYPYNPYSKDELRHLLMARHIREDTFAIHHWGHSWKMGLYNRILRRAKIIIFG